MNRSRLRRAAAGALLFPAELWAQTDHTNLEQGLPTRVEDAYPTAFHNRELQAVFRYDRTDGGADRLTIEPRLEIGIAPNAQLTISSPVLLGGAEQRRSGDIRIEGLYNFNQESLTLPALAVAGGIDLPTGRDSEGVDTTLKLIASRTVDDARFGRAHLNLEWGHNFSALDEERADTFAIVPGYSFRLNADTIVVADFIREWEIERGRESNLLEIGARYQLEPRAVLSFGVGVGIGDDSPEFRTMLGAQWSF